MQRSVSKQLCLKPFIKKHPKGLYLHYEAAGEGGSSCRIPEVLYPHILRGEPQENKARSVNVFIFIKLFFSNDEHKESYFWNNNDVK